MARRQDADPHWLRERLTNMLETRLFYMPSFRIYGGVAGLYDFGPAGTAVKANWVDLWRRWFVLEEGMLEVECTTVTPEAVLKASGHVDQFTDYVVTDEQTGECFRADHLVKDAIKWKVENKEVSDTAEAWKALALLDEMGAEELDECIRRYGIKSPTTGKGVSYPYQFNLMFQTTIGPYSSAKGFLRPETAQGIFVNFRELLNYNGGRLPFAAAQIGTSYRNEIRPRAGLLRVREFSQAEIEHFVHPDRKERHPKFDSVSGLELALLPKALQREEGDPQPLRRRLDDAVKDGTIANETLAYFIGRTHLFLLEMGIDPARLRFRQHLEHEMAHYAEDCWDAEIETTYGWVECVGLADRSAFDLRSHSKHSSAELTAYEKYSEPRQEERVRLLPNKREIGQAYRSESKPILEELEKMGEEDALQLQDSLSRDGYAMVASKAIYPSMVEIRRETVSVHGRHFTPSVIEPSFGIGRLLYAMFEHCFHWREDDEQRSVLSLPPAVAPVKAVVLPLVADSRFEPICTRLSGDLTSDGVSCKLDSTGVSIGRRYARSDELGIPFALTVDHLTLDDGTITVRERDSTSQIRVPEPDAPALIRRLCAHLTSWRDVASSYPSHN